MNSLNSLTLRYSKNRKVEPLIILNWFNIEKLHERVIKSDNRKTGATERKKEALSFMIILLGLDRTSVFSFKVYYYQITN